MRLAATGVATNTLSVSKMQSGLRRLFPLRQGLGAAGLSHCAASSLTAFVKPQDQVGPDFDPHRHPYHWSGRKASRRVVLQIS